MAMTSTPVFTQTPKTWVAALVNATGGFTFAAGSSSTTNLVALVTAGANGSIIESIYATSTDTANKDLCLILQIGAVNYVVTTVAIPLNSGFTNAVVPVDIFRNAQAPGLSFDVNGNRNLIMPASSVLYAGTLTAVTSAKQISVIAQGGDF